MSNYTIRKLNNDEFHLLIPLMKDCFGMNVDLGYFEWKFIKNPAGFVEGFIALSDEGEVSAYYGVIPEVYKLNDKITTIYQSCDTMTHSRHRRKGLFQKLAIHCYEYLRAEQKLFVVGFGGGQSTPGFIKFGWQKVFDTKYFFLPSFLVWFSSAVDKDRVAEITDYSIIEQLILRSNQNSECHSHKTLDIFKWRLSNPLNQYKVIAYKPGSSDKNYTSYLAYYFTGNKIILFDFYFADSEARNSLIAYLRNQLLESKLKGIIAFCQENSIYSRSLLKSGFIYNPFSRGPLSIKTPFIFYTNDNEMSKYNQADKWLINSFDHDAM